MILAASSAVGTSHEEVDDPVESAATKLVLPIQQYMTKLVAGISMLERGNGTAIGTTGLDVKVFELRLHLRKGTSS